jgi:hypothetical protein
VPGYGYADRLSFPDFCFSAIVQKMLPWPLFPDVLPPGFRTVRCPSSGIASFRSFGGRSALLIFVRVALLLPSDDETFPAFAFHASGKLAAVAEAPASSFRRQTQPSKEHFAVAGVGRFPSVLPSGCRLRPFPQAGFRPTGQICFPIKVSSLSPASFGRLSRLIRDQRKTTLTFLQSFLGPHIPVVISTFPKERLP